MTTFLRNNSVNILFLFLISFSTLAHDLELNIQLKSPSVIKGSISFSAEDGAIGQYVRIENLTDSNFTAIALTTNKYGEFVASVIPGHRYRITVEGDEDHVITKEIVLPST